MKCCAPKGGKREQIIQAAGRVFARRGFHPAKVEEIAQEAGVGKGTVYEYFSSKRQLFQEMLVQVSERNLEGLKAAISGPGSVAERLEGLIRANLSFLRAHREMAQILLTDYPPVGEEVRQWFFRRRQELLEAISRLLGEGTERGEIRPLDANLAAEVVLGAVAAVSSRVICGPEAGPVEHLAGEVSEILLRGLGGRQ